jgi:hypothetical protein
MRSLMNGFTTVRDLWCANPRYTTVDLRDAVAAGIIEGPRMLVAVNYCDGDPDKPAGGPRDWRWPKPQRRVARLPAPAFIPKSKATSSC